MTQEKKAMAVDRSFIGSAMDAFTVEVEKGAIRSFAEAIGETNPLYFDEAHARAQGYASLIAPPTFAASFRPPTRQPWLLPLDEGRILAGEQAFISRRRIVAGDVLACRMRLADITEKQGRSGLLQFIIQELEARDRDGALVVTNRRVVIYRSPGAIAAA